MLVCFPSLGNGSTLWILHNFETVCGISTVDVHPETTRDLSVLKMSVIFARQLRRKTIFFFCYVMRRFLKLKKNLYSAGLF